MGLMSVILQNEYVHFIIILLAAIFLAKVIHFIFRKYLRRLAAQTKTDIDDLVLKTTISPIYILTILAGLYTGLRSLSVLANYAALISGVFFVLAVFIAAAAVSKILSALVGRWLSVQKRFEKTPGVVVKVASVVVYLLAALTILKHFNVEITPLIATLGVGGIAVGLALQNTLSNFFAGLHIISDRPIDVGDFIELEGNISGYVEDIGWRSTRIRTLPNTIVVVPNSKLSESTITNYSLPDPETAALVQCGVSYNSDLKKVEKVTADVARKIQKTIPGAVKNFEPFIRYHTFGDSNINFTIILRVEKVVDKYLVIHEFIKALKERYAKEGIEISWPVRKIYSAGKA